MSFRLEVKLMTLNSIMAIALFHRIWQLLKPTNNTVVEVKFILSATKM